MPPQLDPEVIEAGARKEKREEKEKKSNDNLQQSYKRHK